MQKSKYLVTNERDMLWGLTISTVGYEEISNGEEYPTSGHADGYYFDVNKGLNFTSINCFMSPVARESLRLPTSDLPVCARATSSCSSLMSGTPTILVHRDGTVIGLVSAAAMSTTASVPASLLPNTPFTM